MNRISSFSLSLESKQQQRSFFSIDDQVADAQVVCVSAKKRGPRKKPKRFHIIVRRSRDSESFFNRVGVMREKDF